MIYTYIYTYIYIYIYACGRGTCFQVPLLQILAGAAVSGGLEKPMPMKTAKTFKTACSAKHGNIIGSCFAYL